MKGEVRITIPGFPQPKQRARVARQRGTWYFYTPKPTQEYQKMVRLLTKSQIHVPLTGLISLEIDIYVRGRRVRKPGQKRRRETAVDLDNVIKSLCDGMNGAAYGDDRQVVNLVGRVFFVESRGNEGAVVVVRELSDEEAKALVMTDDSPWQRKMV